MFQVGDLVKMKSNHPDSWDRALFIGKISNIQSYEIYENIKVEWYNFDGDPQGYSHEDASFLDKYEPFEYNNVLKEMCK